MVKHLNLALFQFLIFCNPDHQEEIKKKKLQLDYLEINPCHETVTNRWKSVFAKVKTANQDKAELWNLVIEGKIFGFIAIDVFLFSFVPF